MLALPQHPASPFRDRLRILGVQVANLSTQEAIELIEGLLLAGTPLSRGIYIANAHTLVLASESHRYRDVLNSGYRVLADGTGARWAARMQGVRLKANLVGTDLIPELFRTTAGHGYRYFLLGGNPQTIARAAQFSTRMYSGWELAGFHHGYVHEDSQSTAIVDQINAARPHLLLVGMGNPTQECWIHHHLDRLRVPVSVGVGGLFDHWAGNLKRAPAWVRRQGFEWLQIMMQQPHKWRRYLIGNPKFLLRAAVTTLMERNSEASRP
jgi:N-acetylglucosaminyldiphosphoundecaprenol N-acetyl-beta-D-mannosaminyltransferase